MAIAQGQVKIEAKSATSAAAEVRLSLVVSPELNARLDELAETAHSTKSEILRKAVALYDIAAQARQRGESLALIDKDRKVVTDIVGL